MIILLTFQTAAPIVAPYCLTTSQDGRRELDLPSAMLAGFMFPLARTLPYNNPRAFGASHLCPKKQNQGYITGSRTQAIFRTTERKPKIKKSSVHLYEVSRVVKFRDRKQNDGCHRMGVGGNESCLTGTEFAFCKMKKFWRSVAQPCDYI